MNSDFVHKFVSTLLRKPKSYYRCCEIYKSSRHLCDIVLRTQSNEEHHLIIDNDFSVYCFKFGQNCTSLEKVLLQRHQHIKHFVFCLKTKQRIVKINQGSQSTIHKRLIYLNRELNSCIDREDYRKCQMLQNFIVKYK